MDATIESLLAPVEWLVNFQLLAELECGG